MIFSRAAAAGTWSCAVSPQERAHRFGRPDVVRWTRGFGHAEQRAILAMTGKHAEEMLRREFRIRDGENAAGALVGEIGGERLRCTRCPALVNLPRDFGELRRFGDHEAMQRKRRW